MSELKKCSFCGGEAIVVKTESCGRYIACWDCGCRTEEFETDYAGSARDKAVAAWNRRAQPENEPLTLEELIQRCTPKAAELLKRGLFGAVKVCAVDETIIPELCDALEKAEAAVAWIPVTEQLLTERSYYLTVVKRIAPDELGGNNTRVKIMRWTGEDWRYPVHIPEWINEAITETVTHWMPLPEPPKEG